MKVIIPRHREGTQVCHPGRGCLFWNDHSGIRKWLKSKRRVTKTGCWEWTGAKTKTGYGAIKIEGRVYRVPRVSAIVFLGLKGRQLVLHECDNRICFRPSHLKIGTQSENIKEMYARGRGKGFTAYCPLPSRAPAPAPTRRPSERTARSRRGR